MSDLNNLTILNLDEKNQNKSQNVENILVEEIESLQENPEGLKDWQAEETISLGQEFNQEFKPDLDTSQKTLFFTIPTKYSRPHNLDKNSTSFKAIILDNSAREIIKTAIIEKCEQEKWQLLDLCVLPDHIHFILITNSSWKNQITHIKGYSSYVLGKTLPRFQGTTWAKGYWMEYIDTEKQLENTQNYIQNNHLKHQDRWGKLEQITYLTPHPKGMGLTMKSNTMSTDSFSVGHITNNNNFSGDSEGVKTTQPNYTGRSIVGQTQKNPGDFALWKFVDPNSLQKWQFSKYPKAQQILDSIYFNQLENFNAAIENGETNPDEDKYPLYPNISNLWGCPGWHSECVAMICAILGNSKVIEGDDSWDFEYEDEDDEATSEISEEEKFDFSEFIEKFKTQKEFDQLKNVFTAENLEKLVN